MRVTSIICAAMMALPSVSAGQSITSGKGLPGGDAIGRIVFSGKSMCTGALVASDLVLTAAHCLYSPRTGKRIAPSKMEFQAGLKAGKSSASRIVARATQHPQYRHKKKHTSHLPYDLALLKLEAPIPTSVAHPVKISTGTNAGNLGVVSYTIGHKNDPRLVFPCEILARQQETMVMNCEVNFGASGAPVMQIQKGTDPKLVSVISSKAAMGGRDVSVGTALSVQTLQKILSEG